MDGIDGRHVGMALTIGRVAPNLSAMSIRPIAAPACQRMAMCMDMCIHARVEVHGG
jgi:hypothetical protein